MIWKSHSEINISHDFRDIRYSRYTDILHEDRVKTLLLQQVSKLTRCYYGMSLLWSCTHGRQNKSLFYVSKKTKHDLRNINLLKVCSKNNQSQMEECLQIYLVATLSKSKSWPSVKLSKFCGGCDTLKVINGRCITTSLDVAKIHSPITLNESEHSNTSFAIQNLGRSM